MAVEINQMNKKALAFFGVVILALVCIAALPTSLNTNQFSSSGGVGSIKDGTLLTNTISSNVTIYGVSQSTNSSTFWTNKTFSASGGRITEQYVFGGLSTNAWGWSYQSNAALLTYSKGSETNYPFTFSDISGSHTITIGSPWSFSGSIIPFSSNFQSVVGETNLADDVNISGNTISTNSIGSKRIRLYDMSDQSTSADITYSNGDEDLEWGASIRLTGSSGSYFSSVADRVNNPALAYWEDKTTGVGYTNLFGPAGTGAIETATVSNDGGTGYTVNDVLTVLGGSGATILVTNVDGSGAVDGWQILTVGTGYGAQQYGTSGGTGDDNVLFLLTVTNKASPILFSQGDGFLFKDRTNSLTLSTTNINMPDVDGSGSTRIYVNNGTLYSSASPPTSTIGVAEWGATRITVTNINGKNTGDTTLYTVPTGKQLLVQNVAVIPTAVSVFAVAAAVSVGKTSASYVDVIAAATLTGLNSTLTATTLSPIAAASVVDAGESLVFHVVTGATATTYTIKVVVVGTLIDQ